MKESSFKVLSIFDIVMLMCHRSAFMHLQLGGFHLTFASRVSALNCYVQLALDIAN